MSTFIPGARLVFPLADVVAAAEHAAASPAHGLVDGDTGPYPALWWVSDDGTYLMSNGIPAKGAEPDDDPRRLVHADGWGPGTDTWELLGGDDICEPYPLCEQGAAEDGGTFLDALRSALAEGNTDLVWQISADGWHETRVTAARLRRDGRTGRAGR
ncbi:MULTISPECIES: hypothetical protein [Streptomyces]|uniref:DUF3085 domain-containing protein n=1 Tax=Streptomyces clavifer TaxID=68188 RepID=A0ABS4VHE5_9ACTN|nr:MULTISPECIES: hypothetical protein [Streptomyces]MBP2363349.1 hypothetical protein [Streptomyces clavifer]MDX2748495.1 hypothetical protein [Streptomyces sp. NRRL_B-2557]GHB30914.1 hypothetical protein GCM10010392_68680 [Streptomyces clavifer]